jgi:uncharacterized membrane protein YbhN (UPF0104 family)
MAIGWKLACPNVAAITPSPAGFIPDSVPGQNTADYFAMERPALMDKSQWQRRGKWLLSVIFLVAVVWIVVDRGRELDWVEIGEALRAYSVATVASSFALAMIAYLACGSYDLLSRHYVKHDIPTPTVMAIAFVSYAVNLNVGALLGGMGFRYRLYSRYGLSTAQTTQIIGLSVLTNWAGFILLAGLLLLLTPPQLKSSWHMGHAALQGGGLLLLGIVAAYLAFCAVFHGRKREIRGVEFECPSLPYAGAQLALSAVTWSAASASVFLLMPDSVPFGPVMIAFMASGLGGLIVRLPAGIGVLEGTFIALLGSSVGHGKLMAALLAFRAVYYIAPLIAALVLHLALEMRAKQMLAAA